MPGRLSAIKGENRLICLPVISSIICRICLSRQEVFRLNLAVITIVKIYMRALLAEGGRIVLILV